MRFSTTTVKWHVCVRELLKQWQASLAVNPDERAKLAHIYLEEFERRVIAGDGKPSDAIVDERTKPVTYWLELSGGTWAQFAEGEPRKVSLFSYARKMVVINLATRPQASTR